jgi:ferredoxin
MKYVVDPALCAGHGRCYAASFDVYNSDDGGYNANLGELMAVPAGLEDAAREGAEACPDAAIHLYD